MAGAGHQFPPVEVILSWPTPDYDNPETHGPAGYAIVLALTSLAVLILAIRLYTRKKITKGFGLDDILIVAAFVRCLSPILRGGSSSSSPMSSDGLRLEGAFFATGGVGDKGAAKARRSGLYESSVLVLACDECSESMLPLRLGTFGDCGAAFDSYASGDWARGTWMSK